MAWRLLKNSVLIILLLGVVGVISGALYVRLSGLKSLTVQTGSMTPAIKKGDLVVVKSVPDYNVGDVITYINPANKQQTITHRIIDKKVSTMNTRFTTKGDANTAADNPINTSAVVGKVEHKVPLLGYAADFVRRPLGLVLIIYLPALIIMAGEVKRLAAYYRKQQPYILPGHPSQLLHHASTGVSMLKVLPFMLILPLAWVASTHAAFVSTASLTNNSISTGPLTPEPPENPGGSTCTNNNNVNVSSTTNQTATSGNVNNSGNTTGGNATSGNASNSSSTNVNVDINSNCPAP
jgi:signal peptidase I